MAINSLESFRAGAQAVNKQAAGRFDLNEKQLSTLMNPDLNDADLAVIKKLEKKIGSYSRRVGDAFYFGGLSKAEANKEFDDVIEPAKATLKQMREYLKQVKSPAE